MQTVAVPLAARAYDVVVGDAGWGAFAERLRKEIAGEFVLLATDSNIAPHYLTPVRNALAAAGFRTEFVVLPPGESTKCLAAAQSLFSA